MLYNVWAFENAEMPILGKIMNENPVSLSSAVYLGKALLKQGQWKRILIYRYDKPEIVMDSAKRHLEQSI